MLLLTKLWNNSPKAIVSALKRRFANTKSKPEWTEVKSGPLRGGQLYIDAKSFGGWDEMINGRFDSFIYDEIQNTSSIHGAVFWDIGAHFGYHSLSFASLVGDGGHVYAFEPNPFNSSRLEMHIAKNVPQGNRIILNKFALSDADGEMNFLFSDDVDGSSSSGSHLENASVPLEGGSYSKFKKQNVRTFKIDSYVKDKNVRLPDIMKIDVEGAEMLVLNGAKEFFKSHKPIIFMEVHNILMMFYVHDFLLKCGYSIKIIDESNSTLSKCFIMARHA